MTDIKRISKGLYWDRSWRVVNGCTKASPGCAHCWSESETNVRGSNPVVADRYAKAEVLTGGKWNGQVRLAPERVLTEPLRTKKPQTWAVWNDLFHEGVTDRQVDDVIYRVALLPRHTFMILTKRPERMKRIFDGYPKGYPMAYEIDFSKGDIFDDSDALIPCSFAPWPLPNLWLGVTAENQEAADQRIPILLQTPAAKRFVSVEPMLGPVDLTNLTHHYDVDDKPTGMALSFDVQIDVLSGRFDDGWDSGDAGAKIDWCIVGGESGPGARPLHPDWARSLRDQCQAAGVPFFFKQWGEWCPDDFSTVLPSGATPQRKWVHVVTGEAFDYSYPTNTAQMMRIRKKKAGCLLDGKEWKQYPGVKG